MKTFKDLYDELLEISKISTCECIDRLDKLDKLAKMLIDFKTKLKGKLTQEENQYILDFPAINRMSLSQDVLNDTTLDAKEKLTLFNNFSDGKLSKSEYRRLNIQLRRDDATIRKGQ